MDERQIARLFELEPEEDPPEMRCRCRSKWLTAIKSPEPDLYESWHCNRCGSTLIRLFSL
jgi:hypothetical protein